MKRNRNITLEALNDAWEKKCLNENESTNDEDKNIVFVDGIAFEHTDLSLEEIVKKYNAVPIEDTLFGKLFGWGESTDSVEDDTMSIEKIRKFINSK